MTHLKPASTRVDRTSCWLIPFFIIVSTVIFVRTAFTIPLGDTQIYGFCLGSDFMTTSVGPHIESLKDILISQYNQYFAINGRFLIHGVTQIFAGLLDPIWFGLFSSVIIIITFVAFITYSKQFRVRSLPLTVLLVAILIFYEFEPSIINSIPHNINYLWPEPLVILYILVLKRQLNNPGKNILGYILLGFVMGITQEVYVFPLCVTTLVIVVYRLYRDHRVCSGLIALILPLWIGGAIIGLAPGTMNRSGGGAVSISLPFIVNAAITMSQLIFLWGAVLLILKAILNRDNRVKIFRSSKIELILFIVSFSFALIAHTTRCSYSGVSFFSVLLIITLIGNGGCFNPLLLEKRSLNVIFLIIGLVICAHQSIVAYDCVRVYEHNKSVINKFTHAKGNLVIESRQERLPLTQYYNTDYVSVQPNKWTCLYLSLWKDPRGKWAAIITPEELELLSDLPDSIQIGSNPEAFLIGKRLVVKADSINVGKEIVVTYKYTSSMINRVRSIVSPSSMNANVVYTLDTVSSFQLPSGTFYPIYDVIGRRVPVEVRYVN